MAIAGNVIDYGIKGDLTAEIIPVALESSFAAPFNGNVAEFFTAAEHATEILFLWRTMLANWSLTGCFSNCCRAKKSP